ncbi:AAA family ATPase [Streptomyces sp. NPDC058579]|uniref:AAA family ATPase n=1 Tax=Streptomyces sp. NPDC058579 TaxID=3346548 RepID=UPI00365C56D1
MTRLLGFRVVNLLGQFTHQVEFRSDADFVILHGPNGVGKTRMLELLEAIFKFDLFTIADSFFESIHLRFSGGENLTVINHATRSTLEKHPRMIDLSFSLSGKKHPRPVRGRVKFPGENYPLSLWRELQNEIGQAFEADASPSAKFQVLEHAGQAYIPTRLRHADVKHGLIDLSAFDREIVEFLDKFPIHMVQTQRLLILDLANDQRRRPAERAPQRMKVSECAQDLSRRLAAALTENSRRSQELDKSFPRRVMDDMTMGEVPSEATIREEYAEQSELRNRLASIALLDESMDVPLQSEELLPWQRKVLWTYLQDSQNKLATFQDLLHRVELFRSIITSRFLFKHLIISRESGFRFTNDFGQIISPSQLSSGEQHEIVLLYDLLFGVKSGSLVLVDEPEISLHVAWQQEFISDIKRVAKLSNLRFIVATHSPQIVNEWWSQTIGLNASLPERRA